MILPKCIANRKAPLLVCTPRIQKRVTSGVTAAPILTYGFCDEICHEHNELYVQKCRQSPSLTAKHHFEYVPANTEARNQRSNCRANSNLWLARRRMAANITSIASG